MISLFSWSFPPAACGFPLLAVVRCDEFAFLHNFVKGFSDGQVFQAYGTHVKHAGQDSSNTAVQTTMLQGWRKACGVLSACVLAKINFGHV
jgi:hypothetical protein